jgi:predicted DCC family thiol-disulfide oxidoreductase YuxK
MPPTPPDTCFYDGLCGLCQRSRRVLEALDWFGALRFVDQTQVPPERLPVPLDAALAGMPMVTSGGQVLVGYPAVRRAFARTPLGMILAWPLYVPGLAHLGNLLYQHIAKNRTRSCTPL